MLYPKLDAKLVDLGAVKLLSIISDNDVWNAKMANDVRPYKIWDLGLGNGGQQLYFCPLGEIVDSHRHELGLISIMSYR